MEELTKIAQNLVEKPKGILAADESGPTIEKRFSALDMENSLENRLAYREMLFATPELEKYISGVILFDETVFQENASGIFLHDVLTGCGIIPGVKVDEGKIDAPNSPLEKITQGLCNLPERLVKYKAHGIRFTKWRAVSVISSGTPTSEVLKENAKNLAEFAYISQEHGMVPIVEPEVLMDGNHDIHTCEAVTIATLTEVFSALEKRDVALECLLLKTNFVVPGKDFEPKDETYVVAQKTVRVLVKAVPPAVPGVVFLSGGLSPQTATLYLQEVNKVKDLPWQLSFSFGRALQVPALEAWAKDPRNKSFAQEALLERARLNALARLGQYNPEEDIHG